MIEITPIAKVGGPLVAPAPAPIEMREVADADAERFEQLVAIDAKEGAATADAQNGLLQPQVDGMNPAAQTRSVGEALVDGMIEVKNDYDSRFNRIGEMLAATKDKEIGMQQALAIQYELMQVGLAQELTAKLADKTSSGVQTLFRNQG